MITLIIKSYFAILLSIGISALMVFAVGLYFILRNPARPMSRDKMFYAGIAGDDVVATQLDLARAYIETGKSADAKTLLKLVTSKGSAIQKKEAKLLMKSI